MTDYKGHTAKLNGLVNKPHLNGVYVLIVGFDAIAQRAVVHRLKEPNELTNLSHFSVKITNLVVSTALQFMNRFPAAQRVDILEVQNDQNLPPETVLDLSRCAHICGPNRILLGKSNRFLGIPCIPYSDGSIYPTTTIDSDVRIYLFRDDDVIEFEDVWFKKEMVCLSGKNVSFRRCRFSGGCVLGRQDDTNRADWSVEVVAHFETCLFDSSATADSSPASTQQTSIVVSKFAGFGLINSVLRDASFGLILNGCSGALITHTKFENHRCAITMNGKTSVLQAINNTILNSSKEALCVHNCKFLRLRGCLLRDCGTFGVHLWGSATEFKQKFIESCVIQNCGAAGVLLQAGGFELTMSNTKMSGCKGPCVLISALATGEATISTCAFSNVARDDPPCARGNHYRLFGLVDYSGSQCTVQRDGVLHLKAPPDPRSYPLRALRLMQEAGIETVRCYHCAQTERGGGKFRKCGRCKRVAYCSKDCQLAHWKEHKEMCYHL